MKVSLLVYDIPKRTDVANPSGRLRRCAVRINLSCWAVPESEVPWGLLDRMREGGATWHLVPFSEGHAEALARLAVACLEAEVARVQESLARSADRLDARLELDADDEDSLTESEHTRRLRKAAQRARRLLADARGACAAFGLDAGVVPIQAAARTVDALAANARARARAYTGLAEAAQGTALAVAAADSDVPVGVLLDHLEDEGHDVAAQRDLFAPPA
jgi:hypothetical protein